MRRISQLVRQSVSERVAAQRLTATGGAQRDSVPDKKNSEHWLRHLHRRQMASGGALLQLPAVQQQSAGRVRSTSCSSDSQSASFVDEAETIVAMRCNEATTMMQWQMIYGE